MIIFSLYVYRMREPGPTAINLARIVGTKAIELNRLMSVLRLTIGSSTVPASVLNLQQRVSQIPSSNGSVNQTERKLSTIENLIINAKEEISKLKNVHGGKRKSVRRKLRHRRVTRRR
jgi:hypothetical protein